MSNSEKVMAQFWIRWWFLGNKLHVVTNNKGEIMSVRITKGNKSDRSVLANLTKGLQEKIYSDKGYMAKDVWQRLFNGGLQFSLI